jgi:hypothetical protein
MSAGVTVGKSWVEMDGPCPERVTFLPVDPKYLARISSDLVVGL